MKLKQRYVRQLTAGVKKPASRALMLIVENAQKRKFEIMFLNQ